MSSIDPDLRALQDVRDMVARAKKACEAIHRYDQRQTDSLCAAMAKQKIDEVQKAAEKK